MIIVAIAGGLGNQLFQLALAFALRREAGVQHEVKLDLSFYADQRRVASRLRRRLYGMPARRFEFAETPFTVATAADLAAVFGASARGTLATQCLGPWTGARFAGSARVVAECSREALLARVRDPGSWYVRGYWQDPALFGGAADEIRREVGELCVRNGLLRLDGAPRRRVVVHVRRTDLASRLNRSIYARLGPEYYRPAVKATSAGSGAAVTICTDAPGAFDGAELLGVKPGAIEVARGSFVDDFSLMANAEQLVIANSTFSWWAGFLGPKKNVIAPARWYASGAAAVPPAAGWTVV